MASVNTFWIATGRGAVVVDAQRELSKAREALSQLEAAGAGPVLAVILTHPHPDHFGGLGVFAPEGSGIPVFASRCTRDAVAADRFGLVAKSRQAVGDDFPARPRLPDHVLADGVAVEVGGVTLVPHEFGAGEAECMTVLHLPSEGAVFAADVLQDRMTAYLIEGRSGAWLGQLGRLRGAFPEARTLYPGHGDPGPPADLIARQEAYLHAFRAAVRSALVDGALPDGASGRVAGGMAARFPGYQPAAAIPELLAMNVAPVAGELGAPA
jgi:glyoxylase-like metal-dependent hydrolase (beta-lactamase superfamily II)